MKSISVKFDSITSTESQNIIDHYNTIKPPHFSNLEYLDRCEGGFQISLRKNDINTENDQNFKIKQLRWNKKKLDPMKYIGFNHDETLLLYKSFIHVFEESLVVYK
jgi:hypothetical protein